MMTGHQRARDPPKVIGSGEIMIDYIGVSDILRLVERIGAGAFIDYSPPADAGAVGLTTAA